MHNSDKKKALVTGITGQDGSYLSELLLSKDYSVFGVVRPGSENSGSFSKKGEVTMLVGDLADDRSIGKIFEKVVPDEVYNLAAQSHIPTSFVRPKETFEVNYHGARRVIEGAMHVNPSVKIYQASTCEMFGDAPAPQDERTPFHPLSPYAESKRRAHEDFVVAYREKYGLRISSGILFHHESPRRPERFVSKKITRTLARIARGEEAVLELGNLGVRVDWGYAGDYVHAMWRMLQEERSEDYVVATGESHSVRDFVAEAADLLGIGLLWEGEGVREIARDAEGRILVRVNPSLYRPAEPSELRGNSAKARRKLGWAPTLQFRGLIRLLLQSEGAQPKKE